MALTARQKKFIEAYEGNATEAAIKAGYSPKSARVNGSRMLTNADIVAAIKSREKGQIADLIAARKERQEFWSTVFRDKAEIMLNRLRASELLGKSEADFTTNIHHSNEDEMTEEQLDKRIEVLLKQIKSNSKSS